MGFLMLGLEDMDLADLERDSILIECDAIGEEEVDAVDGEPVGPFSADSDALLFFPLRFVGVASDASTLGENGECACGESFWGSTRGEKGDASNGGGDCGD
jgi:hypothetical protein